MNSERGPKPEEQNFFGKYRRLLVALGLLCGVGVGVKECRSPVTSAHDKRPVAAGKVIGDDQKNSPAYYFKTESASSAGMKPDDIIVGQDNTGNFDGEASDPATAQRKEHVRFLDKLYLIDQAKDKAADIIKKLFPSMILSGVSHRDSPGGPYMEYGLTTPEESEPWLTYRVEEDGTYTMDVVAGFTGDRTPVVRKENIDFDDFERQIRLRSEGMDWVAGHFEDVSEDGLSADAQTEVQFEDFLKKYGIEEISE